MIKPLLWKEWHELRWKMAFGCLIVGAFVAIGLKSRIFPDIAINIFSVGGSALLMPLFIAMGLIAEERSDGSLYTLFALPVRIKMLYVIKMVLGVAVALSPILVSLILSLLIAGGREESAGDIIKAHIMGAHFAVVMFIVTVVSGIKFSSEAGVALVGIAWVGFWIFCVFLDEMILGYEKIDWSTIVTPWGFFNVIEGGNFVPVFLFQLVLCTARKSIDFVLFQWLLSFCLNNARNKFSCGRLGRICNNAQLAGKDGTEAVMLESGNRNFADFFNRSLCGGVESKMSKND